MINKKLYSGYNNLFKYKKIYLYFLFILYICITF